MTFEEDLERLRREFSIIDLTEAQEEIRCISTGVVAFDLAMGGGWPESRISEISGEWQSGKSLVMYQSIRECQRQGGIAVLDDSERAFDVRWAKVLGIDLSKLIYFVAESLEEGFSHMEKFCRKARDCDSFRDVPILYVKDSLEASIAFEEKNMDLIKPAVALRARAISKCLRRLTNLIADTRVAVVFVNQLRTKIGVMFGEKQQTAGGKAPKYYAGLRVVLNKRGRLRSGNRVVGVKGELEVTKSKIGVPYRRAEFEIFFNKGIPWYSGLLKFLVDEGVVQRPTSRSYEFQGRRFTAANFLSVWEECKDEMLEAYRRSFYPSAEEPKDVEETKDEEQE